MRFFGLVVRIIELNRPLFFLFQKIFWLCISVMVFFLSSNIISDLALQQQHFKNVCVDIHVAELQVLD